MTFDEAVKNFLEKKSASCGAKTIDRMQAQLTTFGKGLKFIGSPVDILKLKPCDLSAVMLALQDSQSDASIYNICCVARLCLNHALGVAKNPFRKIDIIRPTMNPRRAPTLDEVLEILNHAKQDESLLGKRNYLMVRLLFSTGMRTLELRKLKLDDINENFLTVFSKGLERMVYMDDETKVELEIYKSYVRPALCNGKESEFLFVGDAGGALSGGSVHDIWRRQLGIKSDLVAYSLRHGFATEMSKGQNLDILTLANLMGHKKLDTLRHYVETSPEHLRHVKDVYAPLRLWGKN